MEHGGKHALVTGGGSGIGKDIALALADRGAEVTITGRRKAALETVAAASPRIHPLVMDVADEASCRDGISAAAAAHGPVQICVANAGIAEGAPLSLSDPSVRQRVENDWRASRLADIEAQRLAEMLDNYSVVVEE